MFNFNGMSYDLPIKTMAINDKIEAVNNAKTTGEAYRRMLEFVLLALGREVCQECLGTLDIMQMDLIALNKLANCITMGYENEIAKQTLESVNEITNSNAVKTMIDMGNSAKYLNSVKKK